MTSPVHLAFFFCILQELSLCWRYHDYIDRLDDGPSPEPDVTEAEMFVFLALTIQVGHGVRDQLTDYWSILDQLYTPFYGTMMNRDRYLHILRYLHFTDNRNEPDRTDENFDRPWKIRDLSEILNATFSKFYNPSEIGMCKNQTMGL